jgi:ABC-type uncharacterized transport system substrate-binding protein
MAKVGILMSMGEGDPETDARVKSFKDAVGRHDFDRQHGAGRRDNYRGLADKLVLGNPKVLFATCWPTADALRLALEKQPPIPIVYAGIIHPDGDLMKDPADGSPYFYGKNVAGIISFELKELCRWWSYVLTQIAPHVEKGAVITDLDDRCVAVQAQYAEIARGKIKNLTRIDLTEDRAQLIRDIKDFKDQTGDAGGLIVPAFSLAHVRREWIIDAAERCSLPAIYSSRSYTDPSTNTKCGLISFGPNVSKLYEEAGRLVKEIITKGYKPDEIRNKLGFIENPDFEIVINGKTADALNLIPPKQVFISGKEYIPEAV